MSTMNNADYNCTFTVANTSEEVFESICNVQNWWTENINGNSKKMNDVFTVHFGETFVTFQISDFAPNKKIVWLVTDCYLHWLSDKSEWKNTQLNFEILESNGATQMSMTHIGLKPEIECYESCEKGWNFFAGKSLRKLITEKKGQPNASKNSR